MQKVWLLSAICAMKRCVAILPVVLLTLTSSCAYRATTANEPPLISRITSHLPNGWECVVVRQEGQMGHPHGLDEPLFRADFTNPHQSIGARGGIEKLRTNLNPMIQLYFYDIAMKAHVMEIIEKESIYSWDIPIYFGETADFVVATSPSYVNHGVFTEEAKRAIRPVWEVLRQHIDNKGDRTVEQLAEPAK